MSKIKNKVLLLSTLFLLFSCIVADPSSSEKESSIHQDTTNETSSNVISKSEENSDSFEETSSSENSFSNENDNITSSPSSNTTSSSNSSTSSRTSSSSSFFPSYDQSEYSGYYSSINFNATGDNLVKSLGKLIADTHSPKSYDDLWDGYILGDIKPGTDFLWDMYSNCNFNAYNPPLGNYKKEGDAVNREHSVPQSWFSKKSPMKSDYYHVVPTDGYVNNRRGNYPFAEVNDANVTYKSENGSKVGTSSSLGITGTVFEPIDEYKGDFARIYFYMCTRYHTQVGSWSGEVFQSTYPYIKSNYFKLYLTWAKNDPVSEKERLRNEGGYQFQGNRNPYVDFPQLLYQAFDNDYVLEEEKETDQDKAQKIINLINEIGEVTLSSKTKIENARKAYDTASEDVKALVTNYDKLLKAEADYKRLVENSSSESGKHISLMFSDKSLSNSLNYTFTSNIDPYGFESDRGVQFLQEENITLTTSSYPYGVSQIVLIVSSNNKTYTLDVSINGVTLDSTSNTVSSGDRNKEITFFASSSLSGEVKISATTSSPKQSFWIKGVEFN